MIDACSIILVFFSLSSCLQPDPPKLSGYIDGIYVEVAPVDQATILLVPVSEGQRITAGQVLVELEKQDTELALEQARAEESFATATLEDMKKGLRPDEIRALQASVDSWQAEVAQQKDQAARSMMLLSKSIVSKSEHDRSETALAVATARLEEARAKLAAARQPAREDMITAQEEKIRAAHAAFRLAEWHHAKRTIRANHDGRVEHIVRQPGEQAGPMAPILSLLPDGNTTVKFYVAGNELPWFSVGRTVELSCDGCGFGLTATVTHISNAPVFTPPVIYSAERSQRLTYLVEARPSKSDNSLQPGQMVSVRPRSQ